MLYKVLLLVVVGDEFFRFLIMRDVCLTVTRDEELETALIHLLYKKGRREERREHEAGGTASDDDHGIILHPVIFADSSASVNADEKGDAVRIPDGARLSSDSASLFQFLHEVRNDSLEIDAVCVVVLVAESLLNRLHDEVSCESIGLLD